MPSDEELQAIADEYKRATLPSCIVTLECELDDPPAVYFSVVHVLEYDPPDYLEWISLDGKSVPLAKEKTGFIIDRASGDMRFILLGDVLRAIDVIGKPPENDGRRIRRESDIFVQLSLGPEYLQYIHSGALPPPEQRRRRQWSKLWSKLW